MSPAASPKRPGEGAPSSHDRILDVAEGLFASWGFAGVGLREVARKVGLGKSSLFHHFPTKLTLYVAVLERTLLQLDAALIATSRAGGSAWEALRARVESVIDTLGAVPTHAPLLLRGLLEGGVVEPQARAHLDGILERILGRLAEPLKRGVESGELRPDAVPHTLQTLIGMIFYHFASGDFGERIIHGSIFRPEEIERRKEHVILFLEHALRVRPTQEPQP